MTKAELTFHDADTSRVLFGEADQNLRQLETQLSISILAKDTCLSLQGDSHAVDLASDLLNQVYDLARRGYPIYPSDIDTAVQILSRDRRAKLRDIFLDSVFIASNKKVIAPKSFHQKLYIDAIRRHDMVFGIGPAGTGKTYLAMAMALSALLKRQVKRIILARPAVEAGEKLGFLPGDMAEKVNPYLRPLFDALHDMIDSERATRMLQDGQVEVAPLAFMRGRTLNNAFVILDEAQNTTREQMKMFVTRLGFESKVVITGDITQTDLPDPSRSGLAHASNILSGVEGISFIRFTDVDVVRHPLVQRIVVAYDQASSHPHRNNLPPDTSNNHPDLIPARLSDTPSDLDLSENFPPAPSPKPRPRRPQLIDPSR